jgi:hypothetical protein
MYVRAPARGGLLCVYVLGLRILALLRVGSRRSRYRFFFKKKDVKKDVNQKKT